MKIRRQLFQDIKRKDKTIHLVLIGTKPDIIKQAPLITELKKAKEYVLVVHSGQHYDWNLSGGLEEEFGIMPDINLGVSGALYDQQAQIIKRLGSLLKKLKKMGKKIIPYIYGDTTTAVAGGIAAFANLISTAHVEAGLRTMSPAKELLLSLLGSFKVNEYFESLKQCSSWQKGSYEPYPEQFDTRAAAPSAGVHLAPTRLNADHLLQEGFPSERIFITGNPVSDSLDFALKRIKKSRIFEKYPILEKEGVIRFCVHRRENVACFHRFKTIYEAMIALVKEGRTVLLISLGATEKALKAYGLKKEITAIAKKYQNFIYSSVWPYYTDTVAVMKKCALVATDSGSIQEETVMLGIPGVVLRFNSDRPEAIFSGNNILVPPIKSEAIVKIIKEIADNQTLNEKMRQGPKIYGKNVSRQIVAIIKKAIRKKALFDLFELMEHDRLGLTKLNFWQKGGTVW